MENTIANKYKEYVQRETEVASRTVLPMHTIVELETREFPEALPHRIRAIYDGHFYAPLPSTRDRPYGTVVFVGRAPMMASKSWSGFSRSEPFSKKALAPS